MPRLPKKKKQVEDQAEPVEVFFDEALPEPDPEVETVDPPVPPPLDKGHPSLATNPRLKNLRVIFDPQKWTTNLRGERVQGCDRIDPTSILPAEPPRPDVGGNPVTLALLCETSRDGTSYRFRVVDIADPTVITGEVLHESPQMHRGMVSHEFRKAVRAVERIRGKRLGVRH